MPASKESQELLEATLRELFQAERSAARHPRVEASRLADTPPGDAMDAIAWHAESQAEGLDEVSRVRGVAPAGAAKAIGKAFSAIRDNLLDLATTTEQSYRITLLGVRHGVDLVRVLHGQAVRAEDAGLKAWTEAWLLERLEVLEQAETELAWFAANPARALEPVRQTPLSLVARTALRALGKIDTSTFSRA